MLLISDHDQLCHFYQSSRPRLTDQVHVPVTTTSKQSKGFAFLLFANSDDALRAYREMDGATYQGRLLHILPAQPKRENVSQLDEHAISKLPLKQQLNIKRRMESNTASFKWNALYMNMDDVMSSVATRMGVEKSQLLDPTSSDAAVRQALAETHVIQEAKSYFLESGVDLEAFKTGRKRSDTTILVKNFPYGTKHDEIRDRFSSHGQIVRLLIPPSGTMALVEFAAASHGRAAFDALKYSRVGSSILFLEKAPEDVFTSAPSATVAAALAAFAPDNSKQSKLTTADLLEGTPNADVDTSTLFVRNLNFTTTNDVLRDAFSPLSGFLSAKVKTKPDPKRSGQILSMGFGFIEFHSKEDAQAALAAMNGYSLEGFKLDVRPSQKTLDEGAARRKQDKAKAAAMHQTKVVVKNLPFEATKKDVRTLLGSYGQLRSVRVPRKFDNSTRGFAFAEFTTPLEAANAMAALKDTHLLGRRLHIDYATVDAVDAEAEIEAMQKKVGAQVDKLALQKLVGPGRKKFVLPGNEL
jgi:multiple RNA-binding domain-containing protein 1